MQQAYFQVKSIFALYALQIAIEGNTREAEAIFTMCMCHLTRQPCATAGLHKVSTNYLSPWLLKHSISVK